VLLVLCSLDVYLHQLPSLKYFQSYTTSRPQCLTNSRYMMSHVKFNTWLHWYGQIDMPI